MRKNLCEEIGYEKIVACITEFYIRAFRDPIIGHFFFNVDIDQITEKQITFASSMLGCKGARYSGIPLDHAHRPFLIGGAHFGRRQVIMTEVLRDLNISQNHSEEWLRREEKLKSIILGTK